MDFYYKGKFKIKYFIVLFVTTTQVFIMKEHLITNTAFQMPIYIIIQFINLIIASASHYKINSNGIYHYKWCSKEKMILQWNKLIDIEESETTVFTSIIDAIIFFLFFQWLLLLFVSLKNKTLILIHSEYEEIKLQEKYLKKYDDFKSRVLDYQK